MRVLQAPVNIANQPWLMAQGLRAAGHEVEVWEYGANRFGYPVDRTFKVDGRPDTYLRILNEALAGGFDVVHFHFAASLIPATGFLPWFWDLPVWRALGVKVVFTFHGTDVRLRSHHEADDQWSFYRFGDVPCDEGVVTARLAVIRRYASHLTVGSVLDLPYVDEGIYLPKVVDTDNLRAEPLGASGGVPVVAHAPSLRATKGTDFVLAGLDRLRADGVAFDVDLIEGVSNAEALERMARADIVVEKVLGGDAGVTSLEAMALGRVAVARIRDQVRAQHPDLPVVSADPDTFDDVLRALLSDPERRARLGRQGRQYVEKEHSPLVTGRRLEGLYAASGPAGIPAYPGWTVPPKEAELEDLRTRLQRVRGDRERLRLETRRLRTEIKEAQAALQVANDELGRRGLRASVTRRMRGSGSSGSA